MHNDIHELRTLCVGIDVGSTTTKIVAVDPITERCLFSQYIRHHAQQAESVCTLLTKLRQEFSHHTLRGAMSGSGALALASLLGLPYCQEVVANALAISTRYPQVRTAIELGGQDAKMIFFAEPEAEDCKMNVSDMRMNGSCAGGTGAFIDEIATLLHIPAESFNEYAARGTTIHEISGRCGVFAKTDIQPLLNQGASKEDIALSSLHSIAKQTIGGLAQGLEIKPSIAFVGGPLTFIPRLVEVFAQRLGLAAGEVVIPENPETSVAYGAALSLSSLFVNREALLVPVDAIDALLDYSSGAAEQRTDAPRYFCSPHEQEGFILRHARGSIESPKLKKGEKTKAYLGVDSGSTTTKFVLINEEGMPIESFYAHNEGEPIDVAVGALNTLRKRYKEAGVSLEILGIGTTGYGEFLFAKMLNANYHVVETVAHAYAAQVFEPNVSFLLDIGGQDMKATWINEGIITEIVINEACSSGCGSFLESYAATLGIPVSSIAQAAFSSSNPALLGSRCTVFMNSSIVTEQKNGKTPEDIMAGLCRSIVENVFTKVIRVSNLDKLGSTIVVQGGTFKNDAVLRALEQYLGKEVKRSPYPDVMGALGVALLTKERLSSRTGQAAHMRGEQISKVQSQTAYMNAEQAHAEYVREAQSQAAHMSETQIQGALSYEQTAQAPRANGLEILDNFSYSRESNLLCPLCANHCARSALFFSNGQAWITGNRCSRGETLLDPPSKEAKSKARATTTATTTAPQTPAASQTPTAAMPTSAPAKNAAPASIPAPPAPPPGPTTDLFKVREKLLFKEYPAQRVTSAKQGSIGLPRVLSLWETLPFWSTFFRALGFEVVISDASSRKQYESGLLSVTSDTICFPAKLVHGHMRDLVKKGVDRIFMPAITTLESENQEKTSESMCAVVKGYPLVIRNSDDPFKRWGVPFEVPLFHWYSNKDRIRQLTAYMERAFGIAVHLTRNALAQGDAAQEVFKQELVSQGSKVLKQCEQSNSFAVVLAGRPYHNDSLVNHALSNMFAERGIPVLTVDSLPGLNEVDLSKSLLDITNNYHARMLSASVIAAHSPQLEYAQIVSFGCGHDACLTDEIIRLMSTTSKKSPLILKVDESDAAGPLRIRVRSFIETIQQRRARNTAGLVNELSSPYDVKYLKKDRANRVVLVPNASQAFCHLMSAAFRKQGLRAEPLDVGREEAISLGKKYVHADICFPAQVIIGEALEALLSGRYDPEHTAVGMAKYIGCCRLTHYGALLRKALNDAGFEQVPILTNDDSDAHDLHPGFKMSMLSAARVATTLPMIDILEELLRKMRPYELVPGSANQVFESALAKVIRGLDKGGILGAGKGFKEAIKEMGTVPYERSELKPSVLIVGEYLLNFHPGANNDIEAYLEHNGLEVIQARMTDVIRKSYFFRHRQNMEYKINKPWGEKAKYALSDSFFEFGQARAESIAAAHPLFKPAKRMPQLVQASDHIIHHTFDTGEGFLIPAEILNHAAEGCNAFIILQPFGCLPNHVVGRGTTKRLKELYPNIQILPLDYDPDISFANIENRLQMLIANTLNSNEKSPAVGQAIGQLQGSTPVDALARSATSGRGSLRTSNTKQRQLP